MCTSIGGTGCTWRACTRTYAVGIATANISTLQHNTSVCGHTATLCEAETIKQCCRLVIVQRLLNAIKAVWQPAGLRLLVLKPRSNSKCMNEPLDNGSSVLCRRQTSTLTAPLHKHIVPAALQRQHVHCSEPPQAEVFKHMTTSGCSENKTPSSRTY
jgi:hypothetical protein